MGCCRNSITKPKNTKNFLFIEINQYYVDLDYMLVFFWGFRVDPKMTFLASCSTYLPCNLILDTHIFYCLHVQVMFHVSSYPQIQYHHWRCSFVWHNHETFLGISTHGKGNTNIKCQSSWRVNQQSTKP